MIALPTLFTLLIAGLWHGAGIQFLVYGLIHGCYIVINHAWRNFVPADSRPRRLMTPQVAVLITFVAVLFAEVMFRATSFGSARTVYAGMLGVHGFGALEQRKWAVFLMALLAVVWLVPNTQEILGEQQRNDEPNWSLVSVPRWSPNLAWWLVMASAFLLSMGRSSAESTFLYFQF